MATSYSLKDVLAIHRLDEGDLNQTCSQQHKDELTKRIKNWKGVGVALGFTQEHLESINNHFQSDEQKKTVLLFQWSTRDGNEATYLNLAKLLFDGGLLDLLQELCGLLTKAQPTSPAPCSSDVDESKSGSEVSQGAELKHQSEGSMHQEEESTDQGTFELKNQVSASVTDQKLGTSESMCTSVILREKDIVHLMRLLQSYSYKWNPIGLSLGFTQHELNTIFGMLKLLVGAPVSYLQELLSQWVQWPTEKHQNNPTLEALCAALQSSLVGLGSLAEEVEKEMKQYTTDVILMRSDSDQVIASKIKYLEKQFKHLHRSIRTELKAKRNVTIEEFLHALTLLPVKLRNEYEEIIHKKLPSLRQEESISELFLHLNPLFSFLDYGLLQYIIEEFGSTVLKARMQTYCSEVRMFMSQTTVQQLIDYWPHEDEITPDVSKVIAKINKDPHLIKLSELDNLRREICIRARLSDVICALVSVRPSNSFTVVWRLPSVLASQVIEALKQIEQVFFYKHDIKSLFVDDLQLYSESLINTFGSVLKLQYQMVPATISHTEWIASPTKKIFRLAMIKKEQGKIEDELINMIVHGRIDNILCQKVPINLENIFGGRNQEIILIEGAPGSGKTTLSLCICQRWGIGELFPQFTIVILVKLRDPEVQRAETVADLLPVENAQEIAAELIATNGHGVLWVLDGWDELPLHLQQDSIFHKLFPLKPGKRLLHACSVIVTSRPISSGNLHAVVSSRIEVLGFTPEVQRQYFAECLKEDTKALEALFEKIQENPDSEVPSVCYLPLNASLMVHYFKIKGHLFPSTDCDILSTIVFHCISRHFEREGRSCDLPAEVESLDDLSRSEAVREPFQHLCKLAYDGVMNNKVIFSSNDLPRGSNTLGLLQAVEQNGVSVYYYFSHLSLQNLLAGYYIATSLPDNEQVSQFKQFFNQRQFVDIFQLYAAITKLKTPGIDKVITEIVSMSSNTRDLLSLLHCIHEAQDPFLCQCVAKELKMFTSIYFSYTTLNPLDLLSIGYLISMSNSNVGKEVYLVNCKISDYGVKNLMKYILYGKSSISWKFIMYGNDIHEEGAASIAQVLQTSSAMSSLDLGSNPIGGGGLLSVAKALITNTSLVELDLSGCSMEITEENGPIITEMLQRNKTLKELQLTNIRPVLDSVGIIFIAEGLKKNSALKSLQMNNITVQGGKALASAIATNPSLPLVELYLAFLEITEDSGQTFIHMLQQKISLETLTLSHGSDIGVSFIAEGLQHNTTLKTLNVRCSHMHSSGVKALSRMLTVNKTLIYLDVSANSVGDEGIAILAEALRKNRTLRRLSVSHCDITDAGLAILAGALKMNNTCIVLDVTHNDALTESGLAHLKAALPFLIILHDMEGWSSSKKELESRATYSESVKTSKFSPLYLPPLKSSLEEPADKSSQTSESQQQKYYSESVKTSKFSPLYLPPSMESSLEEPADKSSQTPESQPKKYCLLS